MSGLAALLLGAFAALALAFTADAGSPAASLALALARTGMLAAALLVASLAASVVRGRRPARRPLGLAAAGAAALHAGWAWAEGWVLPTALISEPQLRSGATALAILTLLTLTSWPLVVASLRMGHWRLLHRAVYAAALLVLHHAALSSHASPGALALLAGATVSVLTVRIVRGLRSRTR